ncbi:MAG TPA: enoyl-CoA hydratase-related protein [Steroidobacteraceae bacterium]|nr:enoyl-CoA hydratase-related protein [Steroidobacteraceae bacterium]
MSYENITYEVSAAVATLTLNRPKVLNALAAPILREALEAVERTRDEGTARVLVLTGSGRAFCAGADLGGSLSADAGKALEEFYNPLVERLLALPMPVISAVNGPAVGAGCSLALTGDFVIAARSAYFLQAFVNIGLVPDAGSTWMLPRLIGRARGLAMMMLGERIPAGQAEQWGLIYRAVEDGELQSATQALAHRLAAGPTSTYAMIRQGVHYGLEHSLTETLRLERFNQLRAGRGADFAEGVAAFRGKRPARFTGK